MYKDKDKRRDKDRDRQRRYRSRRDTVGGHRPQGVTKGVTGPGVTQGVTDRGGTCQGFPKRGKDIKCFADLPPDVQQNINMMSDSNEEKQKRTAAAIKYQHLFPDSYGLGMCPVCTGVVTGKLGDADYNGVGVRPTPPVEGGY